LRIAVLQHRLRTHERMDLAAMLAQAEHAAEEGVQVLIFPRIPGLGGDRGLLDAFFRNVTERAPGVTTVRPHWRYRGEGDPVPFLSGLGRTLVFDGDDCIDPRWFPVIQESACDALVWLFDPEDALQAEAALELALDASLHIAPLVVIATCTGAARGIKAHGVGAIVHLGEIVAEGGNGEELLIADVPRPSGLAERPRTLPQPAPVLQQRLAAHRSGGAPTRGRA
jgi:predicted amidohydrolase